MGDPDRPVNLDRRQRYKKALHYYQLSAKLDDLFPYTYLGMGETYLSLGDRKGAIDTYRQGLKIQPDNNWGNNRISQIAALKFVPTPSSKIHAKTVEVDQKKQTLDDYTKNIADRYGVQLEGLVQANRKISSESVQVDPSLGKNSIKTEHENTQEKYCRPLWYQHQHFDLG